MTSEQRLDRLERIVKLMIRAGLRARRQSRDQDEKINILIDMHMKNEEQYAKNFANYDARLAKNEESSAKTERQLATLAAKTDETLASFSAKIDESLAAMAASEVRTEERLKSFMDTVEKIITERRNGNP